MEILEFALEPCPFCGGKASARTNVFDGTTWWWIHCNGCRCETRSCKNPIEAAVLWNMRNGKVGQDHGSQEPQGL